MEVKVGIKLENETEGETTLPVLLPFDVMKYLLVECKFKIDQDLLTNFWMHLETVSDNWAMSTKAFREACGSQEVWPLGLYGDEAVMGLVNAPTSQIFGLYMNAPLYRPKSTRMSRYLLFSVEIDKISSMEKTVFPVLQVITESFNKLTSVGIGNVRFLLSEIRGDQVFFRSIFKHKSWWTCTQMCFRCHASAHPGPLHYMNYDGNSSWTSTLRSTEEFLVDELPPEQCGLFVRVVVLCKFLFLGVCGVLCGVVFNVLLLRSLGESPLLQHFTLETLHAAYIEFGFAWSHKRVKPVPCLQFSEP